ncbi:helix-turn-helix domain-containing protein [Desulfallas thermosapovorans]|uniref:Helix-turn-helix protein n=1 Tax=Desulfallas thermosapovorans DSM 6562 TaxID=1121431 RepID=A0A5S4ZQV6_9FIRM|nr:helix-turn-helix transcriptional regulator [Desulfallas thermosapovorans]TYO95156.1 hypothetical protein LX24_01885 [Desulfallas thermosapovorans DSM 6562]
MPVINLDNVVVFMKEHDYNEQTLSEAMGISYSYLFRVLRGDRQPGRKFIEGLIKIGMSPGDIFFRKALPFGNTNSTNIEPTGTDGE